MKFKQQIDYYEIKSVCVIGRSMYGGVDACSEFEEYFDMIFENEGLCHHELLPYRYVNLDIWCSICEKCIDVGFGCLDCEYHQCKECYSKTKETEDTLTYHGVTLCDYCEKVCVHNWFRCPCKEPRYCSRSCQKRDWKYHRNECACRIIQSDVGNVKN